MDLSRRWPAWPATASSCLTSAGTGSPTGASSPGAASARATGSSDTMDPSLSCVASLPRSSEPWEVLIASSTGRSARTPDSSSLSSGGCDRGSLCVALVFLTEVGRTIVHEQVNDLVFPQRSILWTGDRHASQRGDGSERDV